MHPAVSSVVYFSDGSDPTIVLDQVRGGGLASRGWVAPSRKRAFLTFPGDRCAPIP